MGALYRFDLTPLIEKYNLINYVETGTGTGSCLKHAQLYPFQNLYSIELDKEFVDNLWFLPEEDKRIKLINNYSTIALKELIPELSEQPILFWLDSHFIGNPDFHKTSYEESITTHGQASFPLEEELHIITSLRDISKDVFIIDDFTLYSPNEPCDWAKTNPFKYRQLAIDNGVNLTPDFIYLLLNKHNFEKDQRDQAYLIATPNG